MQKPIPSDPRVDRELDGHQASNEPFSPESFSKFYSIKLLLVSLRCRLRVVRTIPSRVLTWPSFGDSEPGLKPQFPSSSPLAAAAPLWILLLGLWCKIGFGSVS
ncbi:hypothetical protein AVEN_267838-1 [Araneus ventricosus]|uniref:Uncharacterized protein n=1 Tax=Araneus ventricosus TaxID=182803 RepID=A0A4Y2DL08_ARAVE|nr:hypothetical protein AVEN_267838-1 [Araneus ventricosus]